MPFAFYNRLSPARRRTYDRSDAIETVPVGHPAAARTLSVAIEQALAAEQPAPVRAARQQLLDLLTSDLGVPPVRVRVLAVRPNGDWGELHGLYLPAEDSARARIEVWMRTARRQKTVAPRTFLRTLLHELCHHLDYELFGFEETFHTEGFYKRESHLLAVIAGPPRPARRDATGSAASRQDEAGRSPADDEAPAASTLTGTRGASAQSSS